MLGRELLALDRYFYGLNFWFATSLRVKQYRFGRDGHGNRAINLFEKVIDDSG